MHLIELDTTLLQHLTSQAGLEDPILSQWRIRPSDEAIVAIPRALTMTEEYYIVMSILIDRGEVGAPMGTQANALFGISLDGLVVAIVAARWLGGMVGASDGGLFSSGCSLVKWANSGQRCRCHSSQCNHVWLECVCK